MNVGVRTVSFVSLTRHDEDLAAAVGEGAIKLRQFLSLIPASIRSISSNSLRKALLWVQPQEVTIPSRLFDIRVKWQ